MGIKLILFLEKAEKVQVGKDQEKAQSEKDSHSKIAFIYKHNYEQNFTLKI